MAPILRTPNDRKNMSEQPTTNDKIMRTRKMKRKKVTQSAADKSRMEILRKKRESERLRRLKIKNDPALYDEYLKSEKARYQRKK